LALIYKDDTFDGCVEHALHHHFAGLTIQVG
jgi:hypothetical protein